MSDSKATQVADKVKETAIEEAERIKMLAQDAYRSHAYIYPLKASIVFLFNYQS